MMLKPFDNTEQKADKHKERDKSRVEGVFFCGGHFRKISTIKRPIEINKPDAPMIAPTVFSDALRP